MTTSYLSRLNELGVIKQKVLEAVPKIAKRMADCQVDYFKFYDERYINLILETTSSGGDIYDANEKVEKLMKRDILSGKKSEKEIEDQVFKMIHNMEECTKKAVRVYL